MVEIFYLMDGSYTVAQVHISHNILQSTINLQSDFNHL